MLARSYKTMGRFEEAVERLRQGGENGQRRSRPARQLRRNLAMANGKGLKGKPTSWSNGPSSSTPSIPTAFSSPAPPPWKPATTRRASPTGKPVAAGRAGFGNRPDAAQRHRQDESGQSKTWSMPAAVASSAVDRAPRRKSAALGTPESLFVDRCTRCNDCLVPARNRLLSSAMAVIRPSIFKRGECTFCATVSAPANRWHWSAAKINPPGHTRRVIADCLPHQGRRMPRLRRLLRRPRHPLFTPPRWQPAAGHCTEKCTGCGACLAPCPVNAISIAV
jgi:ferredoxin-type protein NapF